MCFQDSTLAGCQDALTYSILSFKSDEDVCGFGGDKMNERTVVLRPIRYRSNFLNEVNKMCHMDYCKKEEIFLVVFSFKFQYTGIFFLSKWNTQNSFKHLWTILELFFLI